MLVESISTARLLNRCMAKWTTPGLAATAAGRLVADDKPWLREAPRRESEKQRDWFFWRQKRGVVVAGRMSAEEGKKVALWAQTLGWPLIGDAVANRTAAAVPIFG